MEPEERWILVVEDDLDDERLATRFFRQERSERLAVARDGEEALRLLREGEPPALVLLDLKLPRLSGMDVLTSIREDDRLRSLPVVVLTSSNERTDVAACYALGCNAFVRKEIDFHRYMADLKATLAFWLDVNSAPPIDSAALVPVSDPSLV